MKLKKFAILLLALLTAMVLTSGALAATRIDTDAASLKKANESEAASGQSGTVDGIISFDYNGKTYTYYHMNDGGSGYFLPVTYMQEALDAAFSLETPSEAVQGYQKALESAMSAFLGGGTTSENAAAASTDSAPSSMDTPLDIPITSSTDSAATAASTGSASSAGSYGSGSSTGSAQTASGSATDNSKDDPYGAFADGESSSSSSSKSSSSGSTPELGDESTPLTVLALIAVLAAAGMLYARKRSMEA